MFSIWFRWVGGNAEGFAGIRRPGDGFPLIHVPAIAPGKISRSLTVGRCYNACMRRFLFLSLVLGWLTISVSASDEISAVDHVLKPLVGKRVVAEGLAWGEMAKGLGERVVLPWGVPLYLTGQRYRDQHKNGRTVRVIGRLKIETMKPAPPGAQGYTQPFKYYALEVESIDTIREVKKGFPEAVKEKAK